METVRSLRRTGLHKFWIMAAGAASAVAVIYLTERTWTGSAKTTVETACSSILNVINPEGSTFARHGATLSGGDAVVRMLYSVTQPGGAAKKIVILCAFDRGSLTSSAPTLIAASVNGRQLGPARLTFLNRFWLPSQDAAAALPAPGQGRPSQTRVKDGNVSGWSFWRASRSNSAGGLDWAARQCVS